MIYEKSAAAAAGTKGGKKKKKGRKRSGVIKACLPRGKGLKVASGRYGTSAAWCTTRHALSQIRSIQICKKICGLGCVTHAIHAT